MSLYQQLKGQARVMRGMAADLTKQAAAAEKAEKATQAKIAAAQEQGAARSQADKVRLGQMAKQASVAILNAGIIRTPQQADVVAAHLMSHEQAIHKVAQLAKLCENLPRSAQVVTDNSPVEKTANDHWDEEARAVLATLPPG